MFANRFTAFVDAGSLAGALKRNLLLTLAEGEFYRLRWSRAVLDETQAAIGILVSLNIEARSTDSFLADTIALDPGRAVAAIRKMRERFRKPEITAEGLLVRMEAEGLTQTVDMLRPHVLSL